MEISKKESLETIKVECEDTTKKSYNKFLNEISKIDNNIIHRKNCKFCNHPQRSGGEEIWDLSHSLTKVKQFFEKCAEQDPSLPPISIMNIKAHVYNHYYEQQKRYRLQEFSERLPQLIESQMTQDHLFDVLLVTLQEKYIDIVSNPMVEISKQVELMTKLGTMAIKIMELQYRLKGEIKTVNVMAERFVSVWVNLIQTEQDPLIKRKIADGLDVFKEQIGDLVLQMG